MTAKQKGEQEVIEKDQADLKDYKPDPIVHVDTPPAQLPMLAESDKVMNLLTELITNPESDMDRFDRIMEWKNDLFKQQAEMVFNQAMSLCQGEMLPVAKEAENTHTTSFYAKLDAVIQMIAPIYSSHGFALMFSNVPSSIENYLGIDCEVTHSAGFAKTFHIDLPPDDVGTGGKTTKTAIHGIKSTLTYGRGILTTMIFNIALKDKDDDDGNHARAKPQRKTASQSIDAGKATGDTLDGTQRGLIRGKLRINKNKDELKLCKEFGVKQLTELRTSQLDEAIAWASE